VSSVEGRVVGGKVAVRVLVDAELYKVVSSVAEVAKLSFDEVVEECLRSFVESLRWRRVVDE